MSIDDRINLHKLEVFELVVRLGGVGRAADRLHVSQPVVSAHLRSLEARLGAQLFYREGRRMQLTTAGEAVHQWALEIQRRTRELERELDGLSDGARGSVVVGASMSIGSYELPQILMRFRRRRPLVEIRLDLPEFDHAISGTEAGENDFSVVVLTQDPLIASLKSERIGHEPLVLVAPPVGIIQGDTVSAEALGSIPFVEAPRGLSRRAFIDTQFAKLGVRERVVSMELGHPEAIKQAVIGGEGVALLFRTAVTREIEAGLLREVAIDGISISGAVHLMSRKDKQFSPVQEELIEMIKLHFGRVPAVDELIASGGS